MSLLQPLSSSSKKRQTSSSFSLIAGVSQLFQSDARNANLIQVRCNLNFLDANSIQVGEGYIQYDATPFEGVFINPSGKEIVKINPPDHWFKLLSFQAKISGFRWDLSDQEDFQLFWCPTESKTWAISYSNLGEPAKVEGWIFGDSYHYPVLKIYGDRWVQIDGSGVSIGQDWMIQQHSPKTS